MTTVAHTPGPWNYHKWGKGNGTNFGIETADHRHGLAGIAPNSNASTMLTMEQHEANARLLASAPELLHAVQVAREVFNSRIDEEHCLAGPVDWVNLMRAMDAAIAKAKGGAT